jgi:lysozyme family protein
MKSLRICGWAVIFTVTFLLAACATQRAGVADTNMTSGPDTSISQSEEQTLMRNENAMIIRQAWLDERDSQLNMRAEELNRRENALSINQAWLTERDTRPAHKAYDLTSQDDMLAFRSAWLDERETHVGISASSSTGFVKLTGADPFVAKSESTPIRIESGRCYASVAFPAEYKTLAVVKPIEVPTGENMPVLYQTVTEKVKVTDEQTRWEEILCEREMTDCRIFEIQRSLTRGGYNPGPIDGIIGQQTMAAVKDFQKDFNLTVADYLTVETVNALDTNF